MDQDALDFAPSHGSVRRRFSTVGLALVVMVLAWQCVAGGGLAAAAVLLPGLVRSGWFLAAANFLPLYLLGVPLLLLVLRSVPDAPRPAPRRVKPVRLAALFFAGFVAFYALAWLGGALTELLAKLKGSAVSDPLEALASGTNPYVLALFACLLSPLAEEYVFRWLLLRKLGAFGAPTYMLFSALTFALFHCNLNQLFYAFVLGLLFSGVTYHTGRLRCAAVMHVLYNAVGLGLPLLLEKNARFKNATSFLIGLLIGLGAVCAVWLLAQWVRKRPRLLPGVYPKPGAALVYGNAGVVALLALLCGLTALSLFVA